MKIHFSSFGCGPQYLLIASNSWHRYLLASMTLMLKCIFQFCLESHYTPRYLVSSDIGMSVLLILNLYCGSCLVLSVTQVIVFILFWLGGC